MRKLAVLGSTGSIGVTTLSIVERFPEDFQVVALAAGRNLAKLTQQVRRFQPDVVSLASEDDARTLKERLPDFHGTILCGSEGLMATATHPEADMVMAALVGVSVEEALQHPTWKMGNKITIDSATLMNKGLEVIEARWLFNLPPEQVSVIVHPQSIVHSMVEYVDGSVLAQLGIPDMAVPIPYILAYPDRLPLTHLPQLDLARIGQLQFHEPDFDKFSCLRLAYSALCQGGTCPAVLNAANEVGVEHFLNGQLRFLDIAVLNERVLEAHDPQPVTDLDSLLEADRWAREHARGVLNTLQHGAAA